MTNPNDRKTILQKLRESAKTRKLLLGLSFVSMGTAANAATPISEKDSTVEISEKAMARTTALNEIKEVAPMVCRDGFNRFESLLEQDNIELGSAAVITARLKLDDYQDTVFPKKQAAGLSLNDFQSMCAYYNIQNMTAKLTDLCAQGQGDKADKILVGFSQKYADKISFQGTGNPILLQDGVLETIQQDIRDNFDKIFPEFLKNTEAQYKANRQELGIESVKQISNSQYYMITAGDGFYYMPNAHNDLITASVRNQNDNLVRQLKNQKQLTNNIIGWQQAQIIR